MGTPQSPRLGVVGATGRLGARIVAAARAAGWPVTCTATSAGWRVDAVPDVVVDASCADGVAQAVKFAAAHRVPLVEAVSDVRPEDDHALRELAAHTAVVRATNLSRVHHLHARMVAEAAAMSVRLPVDDVLVAERHPARKRDRPSATARRLAALWGDRAEAADLPRIEAIRGGGPVSEHSVFAAWPGETLLLVHAVQDLAGPAQGALDCAAWAAEQAPGCWTVDDVFGPAAEPGRMHDNVHDRAPNRAHERPRRRGE